MNIEKKVNQTIQKYKLCNKEERILVAISGGEDSAVIAYLLKKLGYKLEAIHIDLGLGKYSKNCLKSVNKLCDKLQIKLHVYSVKKEIGKTLLEIFKKNNKKLNNCYLCGIIKKWILNKKARELKANKIATGHNFNDEIETFLMNILKGSPALNSNFNPILKIKTKKFIIRIKPLFFVKKKDIGSYSQKFNLPIYRKICPYRKETYRVEIRNFINKLSDKEKENFMKNFLKLSKKIKKEDKKINYCKICGEPSRKDICKKCELIIR
jgi:tRNA-5-methyluridine54 2-sulfurtransferase